MGAWFFTVVAGNKAGTSPPSALSPYPCFPDTDVVGSPSNLSVAVAGNGYVNITWVPGQWDRLAASGRRTVLREVDGVDDAGCVPCLQVSAPRRW